MYGFTGGAGGLGARDGRIRLCFVDQLPLLAPGWERADSPDGELHDALRVALAEQGASFWGQLRAAAPGSADPELLAALWDLVWAGEVTNDSLAPVRAVLAGGTGANRGGSRRGSRTGARRRPRPGRLTRLGPPAGQGRWSLVAPLLEPAPSATEAAHSQALQLVERYGVVTREAVLAEGLVGGFTSVYGVLKVLEERGQVRRGYFVDGLGAAQFAIPGAVDRLRSAREPTGDERPLALASTDPAQPYGAALAWPDSDGRPARTASSLVVSRAGVPLVWFDRRGFHLVPFEAAQVDVSWIDALIAASKDGRLKQLEIRKINGDPPGSAPPSVVEVLRANGFTDGYRGLTHRG